VRWIDQRPADWPLVFVPVSIRYQTNQALTFYQALAARLGSVIGETVPEPRTDPASYYREKVIEYLDRIATGAQRCLMVIDGLDEARGWKIDTAVLPPDPPSTLKIVISARELAGDRGSPDWLSRLGWNSPAGKACTLDLPLLSCEGIEDVLRNMEFPIAPLSEDVDIINELYRLTEKGDSLLLHLYVNDLRKMGVDAARLRPQDLQNLEPGFGAYFKRWLDEQRDEWKATGVQVNDALLNTILAILATAFGPLKLRDLEELVQRIYPGNYIFNVTLVEPLRRFILGDGLGTGYALAHPKLAIYLQEEYFGGSNILKKSQAAFIEWMRGVAQSLNSGVTPPSEANEYALLFYTQHLGSMPSESSLEHYRELLENGWRQAWESYEKGFQGFHRDVELARNAFQSAADRNPEQLRTPRVGLGALIRCALCLSSMQSIGLGLPGLLLAEFLKSKSITPRQALYLVQLKDSRGRSEGIPAIIEFLPAELRAEAYACAREIHDAGPRCRTLIGILPHLEKSEQTKGALEVLRSLERVEDDYDRRNSLDALRSYLPEATWTEAVSAHDRRREERAQTAKEQTENSDLPSQSSNGSEQSSASAKGRSFYRGLEEEARRGELSPQRMREILELMRDGPPVYSPGILAGLGSCLPEEMLDFAVDCIFQSKEDSFRGAALAKLAPHLGIDRSRRVFGTVLTTLGYDIKEAIAALASPLAGAGLDTELRNILDMEDSYKRSRALGALTPYLSTELRTLALRSVFKLDGYTFRVALSELVPCLSKDQIKEATDRVSRISDMEERGSTLAILLPRHRELGLQLSATDAYRIAFVIGDRNIRDLAQAALIPYLENKDARLAIGELSKRFDSPSLHSDSVLILFDALTFVLISKYVSDAERVKGLEQAVATARDRLVNPSPRAIVLGILASRFTGGCRKRLLDEAIELAKTLESERTFTFAFLAILFPEEAMSLLQYAPATADLNSRSEDSTSDKRMDRDLIRLVTPIATGASLENAQAELCPMLNEIIQYPKSQDRMMLLTFMLLLFPKLPPAQLGALIQETIDAVRAEISDERALVLMLLSSYLPTKLLMNMVKELLGIGQRSARPDLILALAIAQESIAEVWQTSPLVAGNRIAGSPLARLGGDCAVTETVEAIRDVCTWWP
jgi:hypothetical protein